jgi:RNA-directed DNA polymerase
LELHPDKTRLIEFGRYAARDRKQRGGGKPETFNFLGFSVLQKNTGMEVMMT